MEKILGQLQYFAASFLWGVLLMFIYDFILAFRCKVRHRWPGRLVEDLLFWAVAALFVFQMIFSLNYGILRNFFVISFIGGMFLYRKLAKKHVVRAVIAIFHAIFRPFVWFYKKISKILEKHTKSP